MTARIARRRAMIATLLALGPFGCQEPPADSEVARRVIGPRGGTITSTDGVLTLAFPPGALEDDVEMFVQRTEEPPPAFGLAYIVRPNPVLLQDVSVSYHQPLPDDVSGLAVGAVDSIDFEAGRGQWQPLPILRVDRQAELVSGLDDGVSIFYALLDANGSAATTDPSDTGETSASPTTGTPDETTTGTPDETTTSTPDETTTGTPDETTTGSSTGPGESTGEPAPSFAREVEPILMASCNCHYDGAPAELSFVDAYASLVDVASTEAPGLDRVEPGSPDDSYLWHKLSGTHLDVGGSGNPMPAPAGGLDAGALATIEAWISGGAAP